MGGYGDWDVAELKKNESKWILDDMSSEQSCSDAGFRALDEKEKQAIEELERAIRDKAKYEGFNRVLGNEGNISGAASDDAENKVRAMLKKMKNISESEVEAQCGSLISEYGFISGYIAQDQNRLKVLNDYAVGSEMIDYFAGYFGGLDQPKKDLEQHQEALKHLQAAVDKGACHK